MIHRYLAMAVGVLILVLSWRAVARAARRCDGRRWWATAALVWVLVQGLFGSYTVTLKLYPAIVTAHLLGGMVLLALLVASCSRCGARRRWRCAARAAMAVLAAAGAADRARRLGQHQLRGAGVPRLSAVQRPLVAGDGLPRASPCCASSGAPARTATSLRGAGRDPDGASRCSRCWSLAVHRAVVRLWRWRRDASGALRLLLSLLAVQLPRACRMSCSAGRWWRRWRTPAARRRWWPCSRGWRARPCAHRDRAAGASMRAGSGIERRAQAMATSTPVTTAQPRRASRRSQYMALTKPRVVQLIVFCAVIGMLLAVPGAARPGAWPGCDSGHLAGGRAAAAFNCLVEQQIDRRMARTAWRPTASGELSDGQTLAFSTLLWPRLGAAVRGSTR